MRRPAAPARHREQAVWDLAFRPDGQQLAAASLDTIQLWDPATGAAGPEIVRGEGALFETVAFSPDGDYARIGQR